MIIRTAILIVILVFLQNQAGICNGIIISKPGSGPNNQVTFCANEPYLVTYKFKDDGTPLTFSLKKKSQNGDWEDINFNTVNESTNNDEAIYTFSLPSVIGVAGMYWLNVKNGSFDLDDDFFEVVILQNPSIVGFTPGQPLLDCNSVSVILQANTTNTTTGSAYEWWLNGINVGTTKNYTAIFAGNYTLIVKNTNNNKICSDTASIKVVYDGNNRPFARIKPANPKITCLNNSVALEAYDTLRVKKVEWILPNGSMKNTLIIQATQAGMYKLKLSNGISNCDTVLMVNILQDQTPPELAFNNVQDSICEGSQTNKISFQTSSSKPYQYLWSTGSTASEIDVNFAGSYSITVTNTDNGCTATKNWEINKSNPDFKYTIALDTLISDSAWFSFKVPVIEPTTFDPKMKWSSSVYNIKLLTGDMTGEGEIKLRLSLVNKFSNGAMVIFIQAVNTNPSCEGEKDTLYIKIDPKVYDNPIIPDVVTPNGDGQNDDWNIIWPNNSVDHNVVLFNRSGGKVLESTKNPEYPELVQLVDGVYIYVLRFKMGEDEKTKLGSIMVLHGGN